VEFSELKRLACKFLIVCTYVQAIDVIEEDKHPLEDRPIYSTIRYEASIITGPVITNNIESKRPQMENWITIIHKKIL
jgi:hypothetical protein